MRKIAVIYSGNSSHYRTINEPKYRRYLHELIYFPDLLETSLDPYDVLIVPSQLNEQLLLGAKQKIADFANCGGVVVAFGP
ncbi:hypothetical protein J2S17_003779 [Cytobacillus purgationiresistens]|uniref:Uncharacterized protein n=1 Tax=Cytobacillus purgationiresistens TaxID=863449 RepID=A0ABU0AKU7_9BACI|nr:hypothetical protein [Cytobacillus purgationiresistens]